MEILGENPYRVRAFANASRAVERLDGDLEHMVRTQKILEIRGIGKGTASVLAEFVSGEMPEVLERLRTEIPEGVRALLGVSDIGPKRVRQLWRDLNIMSLGELEYACRENRLVDFPGFGQKSQQRLLESVAFLQSAKTRHLLHRAWAQSRLLVELLTNTGQMEKIEIAGELRRGRETVEIVDLVVAGESTGLENVLRARLQNVEARGSRTWLGAIDGGIRVRVRLAPESRFGAALVMATGNDQHIAALQQRADSRGFQFGENGLVDGTIEIPCSDESELYEALGCQWIPAELREGGDEIEHASRGTLPRLVEASDIVGALHNHTTDSDGSASVAEMAQSAEILGWTHIGIADHSPAASYANGVTAVRLRRQWQVIDELNERLQGPRIIKGLEADILADGSLDIPEGCENGLEYVVASVHSSFRLSEEDQTQRILTAISHPACRILGHPTGRLLLARPGYAVDLERVLQGCAKHGVAVEINASPYRLDLGWRWARRALELDIPLAVNPDAHSVEGLADVVWGVIVARKAGATAGQLLNCSNIGEFVDNPVC